MIKYLNIEINLNFGNAAMETGEDAKEAITKAMSKLEPGTHQQLAIRDINGNIVGSIYQTIGV